MLSSLSVGAPRQSTSVSMYLKDTIGDGTDANPYKTIWQMNVLKDVDNTWDKTFGGEDSDQTTAKYKDGLRLIFKDGVPREAEIQDRGNDSYQLTVPVKSAQNRYQFKMYQKYYDELIILLGTGLRISELCGLTDTDINFENRIINVDHQLLRSAETGYYIETPKTKSGIRQIPMSEKVYEAFNRVLKRRRGAKAVTIDGYSNFLFLNRDGYPKTATNYDGMFRGLAKKYNKYHEEALPKVMTPHTLRHTFCTNMANAGMNPKALQYITGHSNITMTLNYYAHATFDSAKAEMLRIAA